MEAWKGIDPVGHRSRGLISLMRRHEENLRPDQVPKLRTYLADFRALERLYDFKQELCDFMRLRSSRCGRRSARFPISSSPSSASRTPGSPRSRPSAPPSTRGRRTARMWRFTKTNSVTEGLHNKMELISRRAFGFRNFTNYRLRVKALCG
jgi:hypothetical protein